MGAIKPDRKKFIDPESGCRYYLKVHTDHWDDTRTFLPINTINFSKDISGATGDGSMTVPYSDDLYKALQQNDEITILGTWLEPDFKGGQITVPKTVNGFIKSVQRKETTIEVGFTDKGVLLEAEDTLTFEAMKRTEVVKKIIEAAGLFSHIEWGDNPDDEITYDSATFGQDTADASAGAGEVEGVGTPSCSKCPQDKYGKWWKTVVTDKCPACGKTGTIVYVRGVAKNNCGNDDNPLVEGHYFCCQKLGGCDADFCVVCGTNHGHAKGGKMATPLSLISGPLPAAKPSGTEPGNVNKDGANAIDTSTDAANTGAEATGATSTEEATDGTEDTTDTTQDKAKTYWDMLWEVCDPTKIDVMIYVELDTCYVIQCPDPEKTDLFADDQRNVIADSITMTDPNPDCVNKLIVAYGKGVRPGTVWMQHKNWVEKFGEKPATIQKPDLNKKQAEAFVFKMLNRMCRDNGFSIDLSVVGSPHWNVGQWAYTNLTSYNFLDFLLVTRYNFQLGEDGVPIIGLTLAEYSPVVESSTTQEGDGEAGEVTDASDIQSLAEQLKNPRNIRKWIDDNIEYQFYYNKRRTPEQVLTDKLGNCMDQSDLFVALCTAINYSSYRVCGQICNGYRHCNVRVIIGAKEYVADTTCHKLNKLTGGSYK